MAMSRLFVEIGGDSSKLVKATNEALDNLKKAGVEATRSGQSFLRAFDDAVNPAKKLSQEIDFLSRAGKSSTEIWKVYGDRLKGVADSTDPLIKKHLEFGRALESNKSSFENLGRSIQDFARNPVQAAQGAITGFLETLGPTALALGGIATAVIAAGVAFTKLGIAAANELEQLENLSAQTGISTQDLQALQAVAKAAGLESLDLGRTIGMLNKQLADGKGDFVDTIKKLGLSLTDLSM